MNILTILLLWLPLSHVGGELTSRWPTHRNRCAAWTWQQTLCKGCGDSLGLSCHLKPQPGEASPNSRVQNRG